MTTITKKKLTAEEAFRNLDEMVRCGDIDEEHGLFIVGMILKNEMDAIELDLGEVFDEAFDIDINLDGWH